MTTPNPARTANVMRYGVPTELPERRLLHAGPVSAVLENGDLRYVRFGEVEIVRRLYIAIRDRNWGTIAPRFTRYEVADHGDHFRVELVAENVSGDVDFAWSGFIEGGSDGKIVYSFDGAPRVPFYRNRIGICLLHPSDLAGLPARTITPEGPLNASFPLLISPHQPFLDMVSITHPAGAHAEATITFTGDLFEMEDQRNWTDASYKTYSTPLRIPYPVEVTPDDMIRQSVTIAFEGLPSSSTKSTVAVPQVFIDFDRRTALPPIGFGAGRKGTITPEDMSRFRSLNPGHLWVCIDLAEPEWENQVRDAANRAIALVTTLHVSAIGRNDESAWADLANAVGSLDVPLSRLFVFPPEDDPVTFPRTDLATHQRTIDAARAAFKHADIKTTIGGGTRAYFTELNRAQDFLLVDSLDVVTFTINPTVHAVDNLSIIESLSAQPETAKSAKELIGDRPLIVGPITIQPPYNPNATGPAPVTPEDALPPTVDPRQLSLLGAGWTIGSIRRLSEAGVDGLTYYELYGWRGLSERRSDLSRRDLFASDAGQLFPLFHVFAALSGFGNGGLCGVQIVEPMQLEALAICRDGRFCVLVGSFLETPSEVTISVPSMENVTVQYLDETTYDEAASDPEFFTRPGKSLRVQNSGVRLSLLPFAVSCFSGTLTS